ncbi:hypothetical protein EJB05_06801, partial [Eragrostis curvula]
MPAPTLPPRRALYAVSLLQQRQVSLPRGESSTPFPSSSATAALASCLEPERGGEAERVGLGRRSVAGRRIRITAQAGGGAPRRGGYDPSPLLLPLPGQGFVLLRAGLRPLPRGRQDPTSYCCCKRALAFGLACYCCPSHACVRARREAEGSATRRTARRRRDRGGRPAGLGQARQGRQARGSRREAERKKDPTDPAREEGFGDGVEGFGTFRWR